MTEKGIKWIFNTPAASHQCSVLERQIRTVRQVLNSVLKQQSLDDGGLRTIICEVEAIINNRPITLSSDNPGDFEALTPNHLLLIIPPGVFDQDDQYACRRWRQTQYIANLFWTRWTRKYLPLLQDRQKLLTPQKNFSPGDILLMMDESAPRNSWNMGRVIKTLPDLSSTVQ